MHLAKVAAGAGLALASSAAAQHGAQQGHKSPSNPSTASVTDDSMGPASLMWPPDRPWDSNLDNTPPCGSVAGPSFRTRFPLVGGILSLVAQDDYYFTKISISYSKDPQSNDDFGTLLDVKELRSLDPGHTCVRLPETKEGLANGTEATLQFMYQADWDSSRNQTFYACSDIVYVNAAEFNLEIACMNATEPGEDDKKWAAANGSGSSGSTGSGSSSSSAGSGSGSSSPASGSVDSGSGSGGGLGGRALAGTIVGSIAGVSVLAALGLLLYRRREQKQRALRLARMEENAKTAVYRDSA